MRKVFPVFFVALAALFYSCGKGDKSVTALAPQSITAFKNKQQWTGTLIDSVASDSLIVHAKGTSDVLRFKIFPVRSNTDTVFDNNETYYTTDSKGGIVNKYKLDTSYRNIIGFNPNTSINTVTGVFSLKFKILSSTTNIDTGAVTFTGGKFILRIH